MSTCGEFLYVSYTQQYSSKEEIKNTLMGWVIGCISGYVCMGTIWLGWNLEVSRVSLWRGQVITATFWS